MLVSGLKSAVTSGEDSGEESDGEERREVEEDADGEISPEFPVSTQQRFLSFTKLCLGTDR
jgi:hypothetical protein